MFKNVTIVSKYYGDSVVEQAKKNLDTKGFDGQPKNRKKTNTGKLKNSLGYEIRQTKNGFIIEFISSENYAAIVEEGRKKGAKMPPSGAIDRWAIQRNIKGTRGKDGRFQKRKSIVFAIRRSIADNGIKPVRFMGLAMTKEFNKLSKPLQEALTKDLEQMLYSSFQKSGHKVTKTN